jgi:hypothetical protein
LCTIKFVAYFHSKKIGANSIIESFRLCDSGILSFFPRAECYTNCVLCAPRKHLEGLQICRAPRNVGGLICARYSKVLNDGLSLLRRPDAMVRSSASNADRSCRPSDVLEVLKHTV